MLSLKTKNKIIRALTLIICLSIFSSLMGASALSLNTENISDPVIKASPQSDLLPAFKYHRYNLEPNTKTYIDLLLYPDAKSVTVEVVDEEEHTPGLNDTKLKSVGLKIIKHQRKRSKLSKREIVEQEKLSTNKAVFNLQKLSNLQYITEATNYKTFKIALKGLPSSSYTLKATVDDDQVTTTKIVTKPDFRIDEVSPQVIDIGVESTLIIEGKNLDKLSEVNFDTSEIEIRSIESTNDGILKVVAYVPENAEIGFRDLSVTNLLLGKSATLLNGLYVGPRIGKDGAPGKDGEDGKDGKDGKDGLDGMGICENPQEALMVLANNLPPGSKATSQFDPVLCNVTFGIPVGYNGSNGSSGTDGKNGTSICTNMSATLSISSVTLQAGLQATSSFDPNACTLVVGLPQGQAGVTGSKGDKGDKGDTGATGATGLAGINCWDLNGNRINDSSEDVNKDGVFDTKDCQKKDKD